MRLIKKIVENEGFHSFILFLITLNALLLGCETYPYYQDNYADLISDILIISQLIFCFEILMRLLVFYPNLKNFFKDFWNVFDFIIILVSFLPILGSFSIVARVLRVLRVLRIFSVSDKLRNYLSELRHSSGILLYTAIIYLVFSYIFAIAGFYLFSEIDLSHWNSLHRSVLTIFYLSLLQDVPSISEPLILKNPVYIFYFMLLYLIYFKLLLVTIASFNSNRSKQ